MSVGSRATRNMCAKTQHIPHKEQARSAVPTPNRTGRCQINRAWAPPLHRPLRSGAPESTTLAYRAGGRVRALLGGWAGRLLLQARSPVNAPLSVSGGTLEAGSLTKLSSALHQSQPRLPIGRAEGSDGGSSLLSPQTRQDIRIIRAG
jgi:hypothetical protein